MSATATSTAPLLEVRNLEKSFPGVRALSGVSFDVSAGEVHALLGENGAGKSTLIKIVSGVYQPDAGEILIDGRATRFATPEEAKRAGVATIYQELLLFPELTVAENIFLGHAPLRPRRPDRLARHAGGGRGAARLARDRRPRRRPDRRRALRRPPPAGRDFARAVARRAHPDHGRADRRADRERRRAPVRHRPQAQKPRRRDRLHQSSARRAVRDRRPRHGIARRRLRRIAGDGGDQRGRTRPDDGRASHRNPFSEDRRGRSARRCSRRAISSAGR